MKELLRVLREAMPEIIGGLVVAAVLAVISALYTGLGIWAAALVAVAALVLIAGLWLFLSRRQPVAHVPEEPVRAPLRQARLTSELQQTVLFVDDDIEVIGESFIKLLRREGLNTVVATTAAQAIRVLESDQPLDLIVVDLMMPPGENFRGKVENYKYGRMMGLAVCEKARELRGNIPLICFSIVTNAEVLDKVRRLNVTAHLQKPLLPGEFIEEVKLALIRTQAPPQAELIRDEIERRKLELQSSYSSTRLRALWALEQIGHYDPTLVGLLEEIADHDESQEVRAAAKSAVKEIRRRLSREGARASSLPH